jgi:hypothetical protein
MALGGPVTVQFQLFFRPLVHREDPMGLEEFSRYPNQQKPNS